MAFPEYRPPVVHFAVHFIVSHARPYYNIARDRTFRGFRPM